MLSVDRRTCTASKVKCLTSEASDQRDILLAGERVCRSIKRYPDTSHDTSGKRRAALRPPHVAPEILVEVEQWRTRFRRHALTAHWHFAAVVAVLVAVGDPAFHLRAARLEDRVGCIVAIVDWGGGHQGCQREDGGEGCEMHVRIRRST